LSQFEVHITGDDLTFSAAHFLVFEGGDCERLHGHTYRVGVEIGGPLDRNQYVADFVTVRRVLKEILEELDHRVLLPTQRPDVEVSSESEEIEIRFAGRRWVFPRGDCLLLPVANTTTELLAQHVGERFLAALEKMGIGRSLAVRIEVAEGDGAGAVCEIQR
jgi:6-pyruvoyltetrahydropterin/6-carboxytetrahydropterin synthase